MKKKFYFNSIWQSVKYTFIEMILLLLIILCFYTDEIHSGVLFIVTIFSICFLAILQVPDLLQNPPFVQADTVAANCLRLDSLLW